MSLRQFLSLGGSQRAWAGRRGRRARAVLRVESLEGRDLLAGEPVAAADSYQTPFDTPLVTRTNTAGHFYQTSSGAFLGMTGGSSIGGEVGHAQVIGSRFYVPQEMATARVGGNIGGAGTIYAAIVALTGPFDFPDSKTLAGADVVAHAVTNLTNGATALISWPLNARLSPGWYALMFGSNRFGATGSGYIAWGGVNGTYEVVAATDNVNSGQGWTTQPERNEEFFLDAAVQLGVLANDTDPQGHLLTARLVQPPAHGTVTLNNDGTFTYAPTAGFAGTDSFQYSARDPGGLTSIATATITVGQPPRAVADAYVATENVPLVVPLETGVLANDVGPSLAAEYLTGPSFGTVTVAADGSFTYTPPANFHGTDSFLYRASANGFPSAPTTVTIQVSPAPSPPVANGDRAATRGNGPLNVRNDGASAEYAYFADGNTGRIGRVQLDTNQAELLFFAPTHPHAIAVDRTNHWVYFSVGAAEYRLYRSRPDGSERQLLIQFTDVPGCSGNCTPLPLDLALDVERGYIYWGSSLNGQGLPGALWRARLDGTGAEAIYTGRPNSIVRGIDLDLRMGKVYWVDQTDNAIRRANLNGSDVEMIIHADNHDFFSMALDIAAGKIYWSDWHSFVQHIRRANLDGTEQETVYSNSGFAHIDDLAVDSAAGKLYWTNSFADHLVEANLDGTGIRTVMNNGLSAPAGIALDQVLPRHQAFHVLANDYDPDGDVLTAELVSPPAHGTVSLDADGTYRYRPEHNFFGDDTFTYRAYDGQHYSNPATVAIRVTAPIAGDVDEDGEVNRDDVVAVVKNLGVAGAAWNVGDVDADLRVGLVDLALTQLGLGHAIDSPPASLRAEASVTPRSTATMSASTRRNSRPATPRATNPELRATRVSREGAKTRRVDVGRGE